MILRAKALNLHQKKNVASESSYPLPPCMQIHKDIDITCFYVNKKEIDMKKE